ncbi:hypothetical protein NOR_04038 [Metarhizium rileyi]|uniref:Uncharacterized protein n=1 Tax=Metarhizium rileyi (strain RCEF 4871) TaxID=1649241 RepID=A0A162LTD6_METRR|nr:hypothetical protein NOR_04038 [Metarhizium rileyi RCEF 4871]
MKSDSEIAEAPYVSPVRVAPEDQLLLCRCMQALEFRFCSKRWPSHRRSSRASRSSSAMLDRRPSKMRDQQLELRDGRRSWSRFAMLSNDGGRNKSRLEEDGVGKAGAEDGEE